MSFSRKGTQPIILVAILVVAIVRRKSSSRGSQRGSTSWLRPWSKLLFGICQHHFGGTISINSIITVSRMFQMLSLILQRFRDALRTPSLWPVSMRISGSSSRMSSMVPSVAVERKSITTYTFPRRDKLSSGSRSTLTQQFLSTKSLNQYSSRLSRTAFAEWREISRAHFVMSTQVRYHYFTYLS